MYIPDEERVATLENLKTWAPPTSVEIIFCFHSKKNVYKTHYPINLLRNIGLLHASTIQVLVIDSTRKIARSNLSWDLNVATLLTAIKSVTIPDNTLLLLPVVFTTSNETPLTKRGISSCVKSQTCFLSKRNEKTYVLLSLIFHFRIMSLRIGWTQQLKQYLLPVYQTLSWNRFSLHAIFYV